jgi:hypothetical protein
MLSSKCWAKPLLRCTLVNTVTNIRFVYNLGEILNKLSNYGLSSMYLVNRFPSIACRFWEAFAHMWQPNVHTLTSSVANLTFILVTLRFG